MQHHRGQHPWQGDVDGEPGLAEDLPRSIDPEPALAPDQLVPARILRLHVVRDRQLRGADGEVAEPRPLPAAVTAPCPSRISTSSAGTPHACGRGRHQPRPRLGSGQPVAGPETLGRGRRAGQLDEPAPCRSPVHISPGPAPFAALTTRTEAKSASSSSATIVASPVCAPCPISIWFE